LATEWLRMAGIGGWASIPDDGRSGQDDLGPLIAAVARREPGAFDLFYGHLSGPVYGVILAVLRDWAQAEEVTQEVFLEMWQLAVRYDPGQGSAMGWALAIARHRAIDWVRSTAAASAREWLDATASFADQVSDTAAAADDLERLRQCLADLTDLQRQAITLAFYGEHTYAEVAGLLGVPLGTLKSRIRGGLARLRADMQIAAATPGQEAAASQLQVALEGRVVIEQARGILAERLRVTPDEAFILLRRYARDHNRSLAGLAGDITRGTAVTMSQQPSRRRRGASISSVVTD
jgi:RNA polymerase sigma-70 factor, ECF subfamily